MSVEFRLQPFCQTPGFGSRGGGDGWYFMLTSIFTCFVRQINAVHCGVAAQVPEYVSKAKLAWFGSHSRPEACLPLFIEAVKSCKPAASHDMSPQCAVTVTKDVFVHGVCFKDFATLDRCLLSTKYYFLLLVHYFCLFSSLLLGYNKHFAAIHLYRTSSPANRNQIFRTQQMT